MTRWIPIDQVSKIKTQIVGRAPYEGWDVAEWSPTRGWVHELGYDLVDQPTHALEITPPGEEPAQCAEERIQDALRSWFAAHGWDAEQKDGEVWTQPDVAVDLKALAKIAFRAASPSEKADVVVTNAIIPMTDDIYRAYKGAIHRLINSVPTIGERMKKWRQSSPSGFRIKEREKAEARWIAMQEAALRAAQTKETGK